jgi:hypothetical protein
MPKKKQPYFNAKNQVELEKGYLEVIKECNNLFIHLTTLALLNEAAYEYAVHGAARRASILKKCLENIYRICPPSRTRKLNQDERLNITINLQSFVFNAFGYIDNLAWIWAKEKAFKYKKKTDISFFKKEMRAVLSEDFKIYLESRTEWFESLQDFRHALAHRIPLYVPPAGMTEEEQKKYNDLEKKIRAALRRGDLPEVQKLSKKQKRLGHIYPVMTHSFSERSKIIVFPAQILADMNTIFELTTHFMKELRLPFPPPSCKITV